MPAKTQREVAAICRYVAGAIGTKAPITMAQAAETCGRSAGWMCGHLKSTGLPRLPQGWGPRPSTRNPKRAKALRLYAAGATLEEAAQVAGASRQAVQQWMAADGIARRRPSGRPTGSKDKAPRKRRGRPSHER